MSEDSSIFIGNGPFMNYVTSVVMQFTSENSELVVIKARGKLISRAVDVAELVVNEFFKDIVSVEKVEIGSEVFKENEKEVRVSTIEITLIKQKE
ncbi:DNA-binding protein Alba [Candidatus Woesearchaeota archaeon]|nr:DNA-binding protein Alba [Candidatus Woesearchaeota archaeon]